MSVLTSYFSPMAGLDLLHVSLVSSAVLIDLKPDDYNIIEMRVEDKRLDTFSSLRRIRKDDFKSRICKGYRDSRSIKSRQTQR